MNIYLSYILINNIAVMGQNKKKIALKPLQIPALLMKIFIHSRNILQTPGNLKLFLISAVRGTF